MKCIFIILICFLGLTSTSQVQKQPRSNFPTVVDSSLAIGKNFILPVFRSFSQLATYNVLDSSGRLVFIRDSNAVFYRNNQHAWVKLSSSGGSDLDAWLLEGNSPNAGSFIGTTFGAIDLVLRSNGLKMAEFLGTDRIVRLGVLDTTIGGNTFFEIDDTDASSTDLFTGLYKYSKLGQEWGGIYNTYMPSTQGVGNLYNPGNGFLTWNIPGSSGTFPGIDSFTISPPPPSLTTSVGYWIDGAPIFYPLAGDSSKVINDTLFQYFGGDSIPYPVYGNQIFFGDTATISGDIFCSIKNGNDSCILINNNGRFVDSIGLNSDSTEYLYFNNDVQLGSFPTLQKILAPEPGQRATLRASNDSVYVGFNETGLPQSNSYLVSTGGVVLVDSTLTVTAPILWVYRGADSSEISNQVFTINTAATGDLRTDILWIDSLGVFTKTVGTPDSVTAVAPMIDYNGIIVAYADIDGSTITVNGVSSFQGNGVVYTQGVGVNNGQAKTDSVNFNYNETTRNLTLAGTFVSNKVGGVALSIDGGSAIRAERGSRIVYIDGDSSVTLRSGGYNHKAQLTAQGEFLIGTSGQVREPSARLAVIDSTKGFLPPVMRGVRMNAISSPATGLIVYNSDSASLCLWNGSAWVKLGSGGSGTSGWGLTGNAGTDSTANFVGTTDSRPLLFRINNDTIAKFGTNEGIAMGIGSVASGAGSISIGSLNAAPGSRSVSIGMGSTSSGIWSLAGGYLSFSSGNLSTTFNSQTIASGNSSFAANARTRASGDASASFGIITKSKSYGGFVVGTANDTTDAPNSTYFNSDNRIFQIGNGTFIPEEDTTYSNAMTVLQSGNVGIGSLTPDSTLTVVGGVAMPNLYESSDVTDSMVVKNADGGLGIRAIPGGGSGSGVNYVVASSAPSDTTTFWLDTSGGFRRVWPLKQRVVDEWQIVQWYDPIAQFFSTLKPLYVLGTGQSNMLYRGTGGDLTPDSRVLTWNTTTSVWETADFVTANTNNIALQFAKNVAKYQNRVVRYAVVAQGSQAIDEWFPDSTKTDQIVAIINTAQIDSFDVILFRQGEANADLGNTEAEYALKVDTVFNAYRDSAWFGSSGQIILGGLNEQYQNTGVFDYYQHVNDPQNGGEGYVGVQVLGLSQAGGIHQSGATIDTVGARYYQAFSGQSRQYALSNQPYASWNTRNDLALSPSPTTMPGFRVHLNNTHLGRGAFFRMNTTTSSGEIGYNNSTTSGLDTASIFINQSGNIGIGQPNNTLTTNISAFEFKPKLNTPILFSLANSTSSARFQFDTSVRVIQPLTMYNTNVAGGTIQLKTSNTTNVESGRIRFTKGNTAGADNYLGAYLHFNGSDNTFYIGTNNTNTSVTTADDINVVRIPRAGTGMGILTTPTSALHTTSFATAYTATGSNLTLTIAHNVVNATATGLTITLPTAVGITGRIYTVKLTASGTGTVGTTSSQTIDGSTTYSLSAQYKYVTVQSDGANWIIIANN